jgi:hypothetical protein
MERFMPALAFGSALVFLLAQEILVYLSFRSSMIDPISRFPSNLVVPISAGLVVCFFFWEFEGNSKEGLTQVIDNDPWRRWFWWGLGSGIIITSLTLVVVAIASFLVPFLFGYDDFLAIWGLAGLGGLIVFSVWMRSRIIGRFGPAPAIAQQIDDGNAGKPPGDERKP